MIEEVWKAIPRTGGRYKVSSLGNVMSMRSGKLMKCCDNGSGYLQVNFQVEVKSGVWKRKSLLVHRLVLEAFKGAAPKLNVKHKDGDKYNNSLDNLEYAAQEA